MKIIITLDNDNGVSFNHRRQSRDSVLVQKLVDRKVNIEEYSFGRKSIVLYTYL